MVVDINKVVIVKVWTVIVLVLVVPVLTTVVIHTSSFTCMVCAM